MVHSDFAKYQEQFTESQGNRTLGDSWSGKISAFWIEKSHMIWSNQNEIIHDTENEANRAEEEIKSQVRMVYDLKNQLAQRDRQILDMPLERLRDPVENSIGLAKVK